jgi:hypothetical protein
MKNKKGLKHTLFILYGSDNGGSKVELTRKKVYHKTLIGFPPFDIFFRIQFCGRNKFLFLVYLSIFKSRV